MLESMLSAELSDLVVLDLSLNQTIFKSTDFCEMTINLVERQTKLQNLGLSVVNEETYAQFAQLIRQSSFETLHLGGSSAQALVSIFEAIREGECL